MMAAVRPVRGEDWTPRPSVDVVVTVVGTVVVDVVTRVVSKVLDLTRVLNFDLTMVLTTDLMTGGLTEVTVRRRKDREGGRFSKVRSWTAFVQTLLSNPLLVSPIAM